MLNRRLTALALTTLLALTACANMGDNAPATLPGARIAEIVASPERSDADRTNDQRRKPQQMLAFIGIRPGMVALDLSAGGGAARLNFQRVARKHNRRGVCGVRSTNAAV